MAQERKRIALDEKMWTWLDEYSEQLGLSSKTAAIRNLILREMEVDGKLLAYRNKDFDTSAR